MKSRYVTKTVYPRFKRPNPPQNLYKNDRRKEDLSMIQLERLIYMQKYIITKSKKIKGFTDSDFQKLIQALMVLEKLQKVSLKSENKIENYITGIDLANGTDKTTNMIQGKIYKNYGLSKEQIKNCENTEELEIFLKINNIKLEQ